MASDFRVKEQLPELTKRIVQTYSDVGTINHLGHCPLPNYDVIIGAIEDLKEILYPGYRRREGLAPGQRHLPRRRPDRRPARQTDARRSAGPAARRRLHATIARPIPISRPWARPRRCVSGRVPELRKVLALDVRAGLRRRSGGAQHRRSDLLLSGRRGGHRLSPGPSAVRAENPAHPADDDRMGPLADRDRHPSRRARSAITFSSITAPAW